MIFSERQRKIFKWTGYPIFALICFLFFMVTTLPYDKLQDKLVGYARDQLKLNVEIEELSGAFPIGIVAKGITLDSEVDREKRGLPLEIEYLRIKTGLISSLFGWNKMDVSAEIFGGEIEGTVAINSSGEQMEIDIEFSELQLEKIGYFKNMFPELPIKGELSSEVDLEWNSKQIKESKGTISFNISKGEIGPGKWQVDLPLIRTGDLEASYSIADGKMTVDNYVHSSPDIQSDMNGDFMLNSSPGLWRPNVNYRFKLSEDLINKNEIFKLGMSMIQNAKGKNDYYYFSLRGTMQMPRWQANRGLAAAFDKAAKPTAGKADRKDARKRPPVRPGTDKADTAAKTSPRVGKVAPRKVPPRKPALKDRRRPGQTGDSKPSPAEAERPLEEAAPDPIDEEQAPEPVEEEEVIEEEPSEEATDETVEEEETLEEEPAEEEAVDENDTGEDGDSQTEEENPAEDKAEEEE